MQAAHRQNLNTRLCGSYACMLCATVCRCVSLSLDWDKNRGVCHSIYTSTPFSPATTAEQLSAWMCVFHLALSEVCVLAWGLLVVICVTPCVGAIVQCSNHALCMCVCKCGVLECTSGNFSFKLQTFYLSILLLLAENTNCWSCS